MRRPGPAGLALALAVIVAGGASPAGPSLQLRISSRGFEPRQLSLRRGETARLSVSTEAGEHCFAVDALRIEKRVTRERPARLELTPERAGSFAFYCCLESGRQAELERGELVVTE